MERVYSYVTEHVTRSMYEQSMNEVAVIGGMKYQLRIEEHTQAIEWT